MKHELENRLKEKEINGFQSYFREVGWKNQSLFKLLKQGKINERQVHRYLNLLATLQATKETAKIFLDNEIEWLENFIEDYWGNEHTDFKRIMMIKVELLKKQREEIA